VYYTGILRRVFVILTSILILGTTIWVGVSQTRGSLPEITFDIDFPSQILADGERVQSFVFFKDPDKDIAQINFELTKPQEAEPLGFDPQVKGRLSGVIKFTIAATSPPLELEICVREGKQCKKVQVADSAPAEVTAVTLADEAGNESEPKEFSFEVDPVEKPNQPPVAKFSYSPTSPKVGEEVTFDAADSYDPDDEIASYEWDFGDGATDHGRRVTHSYSSAGSYKITLTVVDNDNAKDTVSKTISITKVISKEFISYSSNKSGSYDIWIMEPDGSNPRQITQLPGDEGACSWSPDGSQLVFTRKIRGDPEHLWIMNADGSNLRQLTHGPGEETEPSWSPDGTKIAFTRIEEDSNGDGEFNSWLDDGEIWVLDLRTNEERQLTFNSPSPYRYYQEKYCSPSVDWYPTWSPDGTKIAYISARSGSPDRCASDIWIMNADGSGKRKLTDNGMWVWGPSWSVNDEIAFVAYNRETTKDDIWAMGINGSNFHKVTDFLGWEQFPHWSPDGRNIAFNRGKNGGGEKDIWVIDTTDESLRNLTTSPFSSEYICDWVIIR